ncbi:MAG: DUF1566 domain-containing protein [Desulfobacterales bacterium]|nr:DUF1566 domain-containing protein [Desulfobacterales bacterium]
MNDYQNYLNMLKSHAGNVQDKEIADKMETAYLVHEAVIKFFAGVEKQFDGLMQGKNTNMNVIESFLTTFEQYSKDLAGLKFQISRIKSGVLEQSSELQELVQYCREEMNFQEVGYCLNELSNVYRAEQQRVANEELERQEAEKKKQEELKRKEAERKKQEELKRQEAERKKQEELKRQEAERKKQEELKRQEAERKKQEELKRKEAERKKQEELKRKEAERKKQEELKRQEAERKKQEELKRQEAERKKQEELKRQEAERKKQEELKRKEAERKKQEELKRKEAERKRQEELKRQEAERKKQEELKRQEAERKKQEELKRQEAERKKQEWSKRRKNPITVGDVNVFKSKERRRKPEYVSHGYVDNRDGTVTDRDIGLMWEIAGSENDMKYNEAQKYINELNRRRFAGYTDWRLPTIDELLSLLEPEKNSNGLYIHPIFDGSQKWCWSSDYSVSGGAWIVYFLFGYMGWGDPDGIGCVRAVRSQTM